MNAEFIAMLDYLERERGIKREVLLEAVSNALLSASKKSVSASRELRIDINPKTGEIRALAKLLVVDNVTNPADEISLAKAQRLDPNAAVEERYRAQTVRLKTGTELVGIVTAETGNNIVVKLPGGTEIPVLRGDIALQRTSDRSLMPDGMETVLNPQDLADLIAWLRAK